MGLIDRAMNKGSGGASSASRSRAAQAPAPRLVAVNGHGAAAAADEAGAVDFGAAEGMVPSNGDAREVPHLVRRRLQIDTQALKDRWYRDEHGERNTLARDFQEIKRPLLNKAFGRGVPALPNGQRVMVTSALPREGKTYCAINLALSIAAERDHGVVLVDADVARPSVLRELGVDGGSDVGLIDWLADESVDVGELVLPTSIKRFKVLPAGRRHHRATELLTSDSMRRLLERLTAIYPDEILVFDSPPLMVTSEALALASHMGQIVMVVAAGQTERDVVAQALAKLDSAPVAGLILNKVSPKTSAGYYGAY